MAKSELINILLTVTDPPTKKELFRSLKFIVEDMQSGDTNSVFEALDNPEEVVVIDISDLKEQDIDDAIKELQDWDNV